MSPETAQVVWQTQTLRTAAEGVGTLLRAPQKPQNYCVRSRRMLVAEHDSRAAPAG
ncbi:hypothetical protein [Cryptosporangium aurantiacum]|uniref:hypothetical protein n=1 Tax=Cryptosporangium aurantiacum TaxID=134849 RepID=UPI0015BBB9EC|nr:hypothetical protein [Cryptosporangium aurantiacum]